MSLKGSGSKKKRNMQYAQTSRSPHSFFQPKTNDLTSFFKKFKKTLHEKPLSDFQEQELTEYYWKLRDFAYVRASNSNISEAKEAQRLMTEINTELKLRGQKIAIKDQTEPSFRIDLEHKHNVEVHNFDDETSYKLSKLLQQQLTEVEAFRKEWEGEKLQSFLVPSNSLRQKILRYKKLKKAGNNEEAEKLKTEIDVIKKNEQESAQILANSAYESEKDEMETRHKIEKETLLERREEQKKVLLAKHKRESNDLENQSKICGEKIITKKRKRRHHKNSAKEDENLLLNIKSPILSSRKVPKESCPATPKLEIVDTSFLLPQKEENSLENEKVFTEVIKCDISTQNEEISKENNNEPINEQKNESLVLKIEENSAFSKLESLQISTPFSANLENQNLDIKKENKPRKMKEKGISAEEETKEIKFGNNEENKEKTKESSDEETKENKEKTKENKEKTKESSDEETKENKEKTKESSDEETKENKEKSKESSDEETKEKTKDSENEGKSSSEDNEEIIIDSVSSSDSDSINNSTKEGINKLSEREERNNSDSSIKDETNKSKNSSEKEENSSDSSIRDEVSKSYSSSKEEINQSSEKEESNKSDMSIKGEKDESYFSSKEENSSDSLIRDETSKSDKLSEKENNNKSDVSFEKEEIKKEQRQTKEEVFPKNKQKESPKERKKHKKEENKEETNLTEAEISFISKENEKESKVSEISPIPVKKAVPKLSIIKETPQSGKKRVSYSYSARTPHSSKGLPSISPQKGRDNVQYLRTPKFINTVVTTPKEEVNKANRSNTAHCSPALIVSPKFETTEAHTLSINSSVIMSSKPSGGSPILYGRYKSKTSPNKEDNNNLVLTRNVTSIVDVPYRTPLSVGGFVEQKPIKDKKDYSDEYEYYFEEDAVEEEEDAFRSRSKRNKNITVPHSTQRSKNRREKIPYFIFSYSEASNSYIVHTKESEEKHLYVTKQKEQNKSSRKKKATKVSKTNSCIRNIE